MYYLNYFFIMSFIGHLIETFIMKSNSGILLGWWTPIYGIGSIIILLINKYITKFNLNKILKVILLFISCSFILTLIEAIGGYLIEFIFKITFWDYTDYKFNIGKYIAIEMAIIWGLSSIALIYYIKPLLDKIISKIPKYFTYILIIFFIIDVIATLFIKSKITDIAILHQIFFTF